MSRMRRTCKWVKGRRVKVLMMEKEVLTERRKKGSFYNSERSTRKEKKSLRETRGSWKEKRK
jgi:hypothetical protein